MKAIGYPERFNLNSDLVSSVQHYENYSLKQWKTYLLNKRTKLETFKEKILKIFQKSQGVGPHTL